MQKMKIIILLLAICHPFYLIPVFSQSYDLIINKGERNHRLEVIEEDGLDFFSIQDFARLLNFHVEHDAPSKKITLQIGKHLASFTPLNPFITIDTSVFQLPSDTRYLNSDIYVPIKFFVNMSNAFSGFDMQSDLDNRRINIFIDNALGEESTIQYIAFEEKINGTLIRIGTTRKFENADITARLRYDWVYVDIFGGKIDSMKLANTRTDGIVSEIVPIQLSENMAQISFKLTQPISDLKSSLNPGKNEILVSLRLENELIGSVLEGLEKERKKWQIDKIMIDPGHGGKDPGAIGPKGLYEKDVVLKIALRLRELLESRLGVKVFMTRDDDSFIPLAERTAMANRLGAKLFISIHANASESRWLNGTSTYILGPAKTPEAIEVAKRENSVIRLEDSQEQYRNLDSEQLILSSIAQSEFTRESEELAACIQAEVCKRTQLTDRGVRQAGYYVLIGASMPNILFETAFISNRKEEKMLKSSGFQNKVAEALFLSIKAFKAKYEQVDEQAEYGQSF
ncbi:N-acetylmuramoyl-L-alanine amidase [candidate division KSB1 bacterium]|nr:N-acetylmuramoyl-L-alanine amidase [candidate division KSB1 bacterium]